MWSSSTTTTFDPDTLDTLSTYLERTTGDNDTLQYVSLNNSLSQVGWGSFQGKQLTTPVPSVKEITPTYNVIVLNYVVTRVGENGESEYYNVEEYYRVRYSSSRMYLLNFERTMEEIFRAENGSITEDTINLGIRSGNVEYQTNEAGSVVAFVQEGELWSYNQAENTLAKVFSFRGYEGIDERENHGEHDIKIVSIDEAGSMEYIVYGYMNRGIHEGCVGIAVYHYDSLANSNEEQVFIPSDMSFEVMKSELGQLMYATDSGEFYIMVDGDVYGIDLNTLETRVIAEGLTDEGVRNLGEQPLSGMGRRRSGVCGYDTTHHGFCDRESDRCHRRFSKIRQTARLYGGRLHLRCGEQCGCSCGCRRKDDIPDVSGEDYGYGVGGA